MNIIKFYKERVRPVIAEVGLAIFLFVPGGSIICLILFLIDPWAFIDDAKVIWAKVKARLNKR